MEEKKLGRGNYVASAQKALISQLAGRLPLWGTGRVALAICCILVCMLVSGCGGQQEKAKYKDGYYTAMMEEYEFGWKEYVTVCVMDNKIVSVEFNAKNESGFIKAWDNAYMKQMFPAMGTYPNRYTRYYAAEFLAKQETEGIDMMAGASHSGGNFHKLAAAVLECAKKGDTEIAIVPAGQEEKEPVGSDG